MAIVRMKKLRLYAMRTQKDDLLLELQKLGCVEVREPESLLNDPENAAILQNEQSEQSESLDLRNEYSAFLQSLKLLDHYVPIKSSLLAAKPEITQSDFLDDSNLEHCYQTARGIIEADERIRAVTSEESRLRMAMETLQPWRTLDIPLEMIGTASAKVMLGTVPVKTNLAALESRLGEEAEESQLFQINCDARQIYLCMVFAREEEADVLRIVRDYGFAVAVFGSARGTVQSNLHESEGILKGLAEEKAALMQTIREKAVFRDELRHGCDLTAACLQREEAAQKAVRTDSVLILEGYTPADAEVELRKMLQHFDCALDLQEPDMTNIPDIPTELKNNAISRPLNMVTNMYSLPAYDGVDPNPLMMPFFVLFYGIMMADMAYGLMMMIAGLVVIKKKKPRGGTQHFCELLFECGISTFFVGALTGSFFGDAPLQVARIINPNTAFTGLPALFSPLNDTIMILIGAMILGIIQIIAGMIVNFVETTKKGHFWDALMDQGSWWLLFAGIGIGALGYTWWVAIAGVAALIFTQGRSKPTVIGKFVGGLSSLYDVTGYLGDILSYSRLMALMLAGSVIAQVFNTLGALPGNIFVFIPIFLIGHAINFGLNMLGCYVHDLRLQCLEYFNKFYKDGGRPFKPLDINPHYVDIAN